MIPYLLASVIAATPYAKTYPREIGKYEMSVCRVLTDDGGGESSHGSGCLITSDGTDYVVTAYHVINEARTIYATWDGENKHVLHIYKKRSDIDVAVCRIVGQVPATIPRVKMYGAPLARGDMLYAFGFGSTTENRLRCSGGPVVGFGMTRGSNEQVWADFAGHTRQGDSGGPVFIVTDGSVFFTGPLWGSAMDRRRGHYTIASVRPYIVRELLGTQEVQRASATFQIPKLIKTPPQQERRT